MRNKLLGLIFTGLLLFPMLSLASTPKPAFFDDIKSQADMQKLSDVQKAELKAYLSSAALENTNATLKVDSVDVSLDKTNYLKDDSIHVSLVLTSQTLQAYADSHKDQENDLNLAAVFELLDSQGVPCLELTEKKFSVSQLNPVFSVRAIRDCSQPSAIVSFSDWNGKILGKWTIKTPAIANPVKSSVEQSLAKTQIVSEKSQAIPGDAKFKTWLFFGLIILVLVVLSAVVWKTGSWKKIPFWRASIFIFFAFLFGGTLMVSAPAAAMYYPPADVAYAGYVDFGFYDFTANTKAACETSMQNYTAVDGHKFTGSCTLGGGCGKCPNHKPLTCSGPYPDKYGACIYYEPLFVHKENWNPVADNFVTLGGLGYGGGVGRSVFSSSGSPKSIYNVVTHNSNVDFIKNDKIILSAPFFNANGSFQGVPFEKDNIKYNIGSLWIDGKVNPIINHTTFTYWNTSIVPNLAVSDFKTTSLFSYKLVNAVGPISCSVEGSAGVACIATDKPTEENPVVVEIAVKATEKIPITFYSEFDTTKTATENNENILFQKSYDIAPMTYLYMYPTPVSVDGGWSDWSFCSCSSGSLGTQTRTCTNPAPAGIGSPCTGASTQSCSCAANPQLSLSASPVSVQSGGTSTLTWTTTNVTACTASGDWTGTKNATGGSETTGILLSNPATSVVSKVRGSASINNIPASDKTYNFTLACTGPAGPISKTVTVTALVPKPAPTLEFVATPTQVLSGSASTLKWTATNADSCEASGDWSGSKAPTSGTQSTGALTANKSYTLTCTGSGGQVEKVVNIGLIASLPPKPTLTFYTSEPNIESGTSSDLWWWTTDAASCTASNGWTGDVATSGSFIVSPSTTTTYTLACTGAGGVTEPQNVTITVNSSAVPVAACDPLNVCRVSNNDSLTACDDGTLGKKESNFQNFPSFSDPDQATACNATNCGTTLKQVCSCVRQDLNVCFQEETCSASDVCPADPADNPISKTTCPACATTGGGGSSSGGSSRWVEVTPE